MEAGARTLKYASRGMPTGSARADHPMLCSACAHPSRPGRDFQAVIGVEARGQVLEQEGALPDLLVACVGGGSNAIGLFHAFLDDPVELVGVEAGGRSPGRGDHAARFVTEPGGAPARPPDPLARTGVNPALALPVTTGSVGVLHGTRTYLLQDEAGNVLPTHSVSAGLDYPAVGPEHALLHDQGRVRTAGPRRGALAPLPQRDGGHLPRSIPRTRWPGLCGSVPLRRDRVTCTAAAGDKDLGVLHDPHRRPSREAARGGNSFVVSSPRAIVPGAHGVGGRRRDRARGLLELGAFSDRWLKGP